MQEGHSSKLQSLRCYFFLLLRTKSVSHFLPRFDFHGNFLLRIQRALEDSETPDLLLSSLIWRFMSRKTYYIGEVHDIISVCRNILWVSSPCE